MAVEAKRATFLKLKTNKQNEILNPNPPYENKSPI